MKRSEINAALRAAREAVAAHRFALPAWADWTLDDHHAHAEQSRFLTQRQIGWDVTDFGSGDFARRGLALLCLRNGIQNDPAERPYAEKLLFIEDGQETPFHCHKVKLEDIIVRGGGALMVEFTAEGSLPIGPWEPRIDGAAVDPFAGQLAIPPGASITIPRGLMHRFWGRGRVFVAEVSQCNDDRGDNFFLEPLGRFSDVVEDEAALLPLWNEIA